MLYNNNNIHCHVVFSACDCYNPDSNPCHNDGMCYCKKDSSDALCDCDGTWHTGDTCDDPGKFGDIYILLHYYDRYQ